MVRKIFNTDDIIDSRDVIARIEELREEIEQDEFEVREAGEEAVERMDSDHTRCMATCGECGRSWDDNVVTGRTPAPSARCPFEASHDAVKELASLEALQEEAEDYSSDWRYGVTLVRGSYFEDYARQLANDIGAVDANSPWPNNCIDWKLAASELQMEYTSVEFDDVTYWTC